jgi:hypothetical protein
MFHVENWSRFKAAYVQGLTRAVTESERLGTAAEERHGYGPDYAPIVAEKMIRAIEQSGSVKAVVFTSRGFRYACRELKIPHTAKAMDAFIQGR